MAFNELQVGRYNAILTKLLAMAEGSPAPTLAPEVLAAIILENQRPEFEFLGGSNLVHGQVDAAAVAAQFTQVQLFNPVGSGALVIIEQIVLTNQSGGSRNYQLRMNSAVIGADTNSNIVRDTRRPGIPAGMNLGGTAQLRTVAAVAVGGSGSIFQVVSMPATQTFILKREIVLSAGFGVMAVPDAVLTGCTAGFSWRERHLEDSEVR